MELMPLAGPDQTDPGVATARRPSRTPREFHRRLEEAASLETTGVEPEDVTSDETPAEETVAGITMEDEPIDEGPPVPVDGSAKPPPADGSDRDRPLPPDEPPPPEASPPPEVLKPLTPLRGRTWDAAAPTPGMLPPGGEKAVSNAFAVAEAGADAQATGRGAIPDPSPTDPSTSISNQTEQDDGDPQREGRTEMDGSPETGKASGDAVPSRGFEPLVGTSAAGEAVEEIVRATQAIRPEAAPAVAEVTGTVVREAVPQLATTPAEAHRAVAGTVRLLVRDGGGEARIQLSPPELGKVAIEVRVEDGNVHARLQVERPEVLDLFSRHGNDLRSTLEQLGLGLEDLTVEIGEERERRSDPRDEAAAAGGRESDADSEETEETASVERTAIIGPDGVDVWA